MKSYWGGNDNDEVKKSLGKDDKSKIVENVENRIYFYSEIDREPILTLNKTIREKGNEFLSRKFIEENEHVTPIYLHINSYGGSLFDGFAGMDEIRLSKVPIYTVIDGVCASAATFLSIVGKKRFINKHAFMLIHQLSSVMWGKYSEFEDEMKNLDKLMITIKDIYAQYTEVPVDKLEKILEHDIYFDAETCLKYKMVDEIK